MPSLNDKLHFNINHQIMLRFKNQIKSGNFSDV